MQVNRPFVLSIAGFDPCGGAGALADIKTIEQHKAIGISILTGLTIQTEKSFHEVNWRPPQDILREVKFYMKAYEIQVVKIGIVPDWLTLEMIIEFILEINPNAKIILDPVLKSSTGYNFQKEIMEKELFKTLKNLALFTPNVEEIANLSNNKNTPEFIDLLSLYCPIYLKGGHALNKKGTDFLIIEKDVSEIPPFNKIGIYQKHGSGCILSSAIAANLALGLSLMESCIKAKKYTENILMSNKSLLAYHAL